MGEADKGAIIMLAGPIKHWWDGNWDTPEHWHYDAWRRTVNDGLVSDGYLVYRPHEAFKGSWTERAQSVNDLVLQIADVIIDLRPPGIPSLGTDGELHFAMTHGAAQILPAPPPENFEVGVNEILRQLQARGVARAIINQEIVIDSIGLREDRRWMFNSAITHFCGQVLRLHYDDEKSSIDVVDARQVLLPEDDDIAHVTSTRNDQHQIPFLALRKLEILAREA